MIRFRWLITVFTLAAITAPVSAQELAKQLRELNPTVVTNAEQAKAMEQMVYQDVRGRLREASQRETKLWRGIQDRSQWEKYRDQRYAALRQSLGQYPEPPKDLKVRVTKTIRGDGYVLENIVFESQPGLVVTANLYSPAQPTGKPMPGIIVQSSHHNPKTQSELQDMGMLWARAGCIVIVPDTLGHGERRAHTFKTAADYPEEFRPSRQDYYFRYNTSLQLYTIGNSLIGWMAWDLMRCVDLLLSRPGIAKDKIILLGSVAGGGDPAGVTAALDSRIACVVPFNFGGPQPETVFPLPLDAEDSFNYTGGGSWESTRGIAFSARDGFLPWVIVGGVAPRYLIHAHEFAWDAERDPVWKRYQKLFTMYGVPERLSVAHGSGSVSGKAPESTHCNNIGAVHRRPIYPYFQKWFGIPTAEKEFQDRKPGEELLCLTAADKPKQLFEVAGELGRERAEAARQRRAALPADGRAQRLREEWSRILGNEKPQEPLTFHAERNPLDKISVQRVLLTTEPNIQVPILILRPKAAKPPVVVGFAQEGKQEFLKQRADDIAQLLESGIAVCLVDLRGTGESRTSGRGRTSGSTSVSASEFMLGQTMVGSRLYDLRRVVKYLREESGLDKSRIALWGDSFAAVNPPDRRLDVPLDAAKMPSQAEPMGGIVALLAGLYEPDIKAIYANGGLVSYQSLLGSQFLYVPHDAVVLGALTTGDLVDVAAAVAPRPLRLDGLVNGLNLRVAAPEVTKAYALASEAYRAAGSADRLVLNAEGAPAQWLKAQLMK